MKATAGVLLSLIVFIISWCVVALILFLIGIIATQARRGIGLFHYLHTVVVWLLSPGVGGFFAVYVTAWFFTSISPHQIYTNFLSVTMTIAVMSTLLVLTIGSASLSAWDILLLMLQVAAIVFGARVGEAASDDVRG